MKRKYGYVYTIGCQMNVYDSGRILGELQSLGYHAALSMETADLIVVNTCAIREKAEQKAFSFLGRTLRLKRKNPELIIGVGGCVAQQQGEQILKQMPHLDFVFGTHAVGRLAGIVGRVEKERCRIVDIALSDTIEEPMVQSGPQAQGPTHFVTVMQGCDNFCSYCVVPHVRGREASRRPDRILAEIRSLVASGVREVTLLGQNVNSYGKKEGLPSFADLLAEVNQVEGLERIRFTTSHPKDLSEDLMRSFADLEKLCRHIHLPVQSGSDRILRRMNRKYTRRQYLQKAVRLRELCPDIALTSDIIVGYPGESDADFRATLDILREAEFDNIFAFKYSDRPPAPSVSQSGKIDEALKSERLQNLLAAQEEITQRKNGALVGTTVEILVDGFSKRHGGQSGSEFEDAQWSGRTGGNKIVNFRLTEAGTAAAGLHSGQLLRVRIQRALPHSLWGVPIETETASAHSKGEESYAA